MTHLSTKKADDQRVFRIARELGIGLEDAAVTCAGFELAFSDDSLRREIFGIIDRLDDEAAKKGEPLGLILSYAVELEQGGIRVGRYADEIPAGPIVNLTPTDRAMIFLKIKDNFPTQQFLGPLLVNRPVREFEREIPEPEWPDGFSTSRIDRSLHLGHTHSSHPGRTLSVSIRSRVAVSAYWSEVLVKFGRPYTFRPPAPQHNKSHRRVSLRPVDLGPLPAAQRGEPGTLQKRKMSRAAPGNKTSRDTRLTSGSLKSNSGT